MKSRDRTRDGNFEKSHSTVTYTQNNMYKHTYTRHSGMQPIQ